MKAFLNIILAILRELADENAYARHLRAHNLSASDEHWRSFHDERLRGKYQNAKCC